MMGMFDLTGKVAIVTGGNGGIGLGIAHGLVENGATVVVAGRDREKTERAVAELNEQRAGSASANACDVTNAEQVQAMVRQTVDRYGQLNIIVNNAGIGIRKRPEEYSLDEWHRIVDTNLTAVFVGCQAAYEPMKKAGGGKIVNIGSMASLFGHPWAAIYAASKGGVVQLSKSLAIAWAPDNIQVNCILPGWIETNMTNAARAYSPQLYDRVLARTPAERWGQPADLAGTACFLASQASDFVTGVSIAVDGGYSIQMP
ncbi:MAG: glucose 1-dehydrogenase [Chloroflexi bacterium]|nr:glucose 1-dehydrogenase [Chloroflexota bacterium]